MGVLKISLGSCKYVYRQIIKWCYDRFIMTSRIIIKKEDVVPFIYFVCSMAQRGRMYGGLSGKSDYIGGIFDRWINIIPESIIFNKYFLPKISKNLSVISDYYEYDPKKSGIAPDVLGVRVGKDIKPFVKYVDKWQALQGAPQIEVKTFKKAQYMVSLRDQGYDDKYLVMIDMNLDADYLLPFFEKEIVSDNIYKKLKMNDESFIESNKSENLSLVTKVTRSNSDLGSLELITVCLAKDFMYYANLCSAHESPFYVKEIKEAKKTSANTSNTLLINYLTQNSNGLYRWKVNILDGNIKHKMLDISIDDIDNIYYVKNSKSSVTVMTEKEVILNGFVLEANKMYIVKFQLLDRASNNGEEYFINKSLVEKIPSKENSMLNDIKQFIKK